MKGSIEKLASGRFRARQGRKTLGTFDTGLDAAVALGARPIVHVPGLVDAVRDASHLDIGLHALVAWWRCFAQAAQAGTFGRVYLISGDYDGLCFKFGFTRNMSRRLRDLQNACLFDIKLVRDIPGSTAMERALHDELAPHRIRGEWYCATQEVAFAAMAVAFAQPIHADGRRAA